MTIKYIESIDDVIEIHRKTVEISGGGSDGILNTASLESAIDFIRDDDYYPTFIDKLTHLVFVANKSHCFQDGNKRIAISLGMKFLLDNGFLFAAQRFIFKMEIISLHLAAGRINKDFLKKLIESIVYEEDYSESLKMELLECISREI
jgi:death-on-curing protein